jgi:hypothetical protein
MAPQGAVPPPACPLRNAQLAADWSREPQIIEEIYDRRYAEDVQELEARCG